MTRLTPSLLAKLTPAQIKELADLVAHSKDLWHPLAGPQTAAYRSKAQVLGYGGAAGGGKTSLGCGLALKHTKTAIFRQNGTELSAIIDELAVILGSREGFNSQDRIWRTTNGEGKSIQIELGSFPNPHDCVKYQGRPHSLIVYDEAANMRESDVRFLMGWLRSTDPNERCRVLMTFNPPTSSEGRWVVDYFGPWLDKQHPHPADDGELRWFATIDGKDVEVQDDRPFVLVGDEVDYDFDEANYPASSVIRPMSRTFITSKVTDNPFLATTGYLARLQALPEPLRSMMLHGDFTAGMEDDPYQVVPTAWVEEAMDRWVEQPTTRLMDSVGIDVARGGKDETVICTRYGMWFSKPTAIPGTQTPDGQSVAGQAFAHARDGAPIHIDVIGVGSSPYDFLRQSEAHVIGVNVALATHGTDQSGGFGFTNVRSEHWWRMREALDPTNRTGIMLPPHKQLLADLTAPTWSMSGRTLKVQSRDELIKKLGRSPDYASAYLLALMDTPTRRELKVNKGRSRDYNPLDRKRIRR